MTIKKTSESAGRRMKTRRGLTQAYEFAALSAGFSCVAGADEAGRGPLAGPVVAAAVVISPEFGALPVNDSKKLTAKRRERLFEEIIRHAAAHRIVSIGVVELDSLNIYRAALLAMKRAVEELQVKPDFVYVDGPKGIDIKAAQCPLIDGDARCCSVAAASILAKVTRDRIMVEYDEVYPGYGFSRHKGYGTREHMEALRRLGPSPIHRRSFAPVREMIER